MLSNKFCFYPRDAVMLAPVLAAGLCLCVTCWYCVKMAEWIHRTFPWHIIHHVLRKFEFGNSFFTVAECHKQVTVVGLLLNTVNGECGQVLLTVACWSHWAVECDGQWGVVWWLGVSWDLVVSSVSGWLVKHIIVILFFIIIYLVGIRVITTA